MTVLEGAALDQTLRKYSELQQLFEVKGGYETAEYEELNKLYQRKEELDQELEAVMELWLNMR